MRLSRNCFSRRALTAALVTGACVAAPASANTTPLGSTVIGYTAASAATCYRPSFTQALKAFGDTRWYVLAPGAGFNFGAPGWQFTGGARLAADPARGPSLVIPPGASAISPGFCVDLALSALPVLQPASSPTDPSKGRILVEVVYPQLAGPRVDRGHRSSTASRAIRRAGAGGFRSDVDLKPDFAGSVPARAMSRCASRRSSPATPASGASTTS